MNNRRKKSAPLSPSTMRASNAYYLHDQTEAKEKQYPSFAMVNKHSSTRDILGNVNDVDSLHVRRIPVRVRSSPQVRSESVSHIPNKFK